MSCATAGWYVTLIHAGRNVAVVPLDDQIIHFVHRSELCPCDPNVEVINDGRGVMFTHHALDGRE